MSSSPSNDALLTELDRVVKDTLSYFDGAGRSTPARVDRWQARDILMHFIYFHDATAWGMQAAALGGPPWPLPADADTINEVCRRLHAHESFDELLTQVRRAHAAGRRGRDRGGPRTDEGPRRVGGRLAPRQSSATSAAWPLAALFHTA